MKTNVNKSESDEGTTSYVNKYIVKDQYDMYIKKISKPVIDIKKEILTMNTQIKKANFFNTSMSFDQNVDVKNTTYENITNNVIKGEIKKKL